MNTSTPEHPYAVDGFTPIDDILVMDERELVAFFGEQIYSVLGEIVYGGQVAREQVAEVEMRTCKKCGNAYPLTSEHFPTHSKGAGFEWTCKKCKAEMDRRYREANRDKVREKNQRWHEANRDKVREKHRRYYEANRDEVREKHRRYYEVNGDEVRENSRRWKQGNPDKARAIAHNRRARKRNLPNTLTADHVTYALDYFYGCCAVCGRQLIDLFGERKLALDHWIPLASPDCPGTIPTNMLPLCHGIDGCNNRKHDTDPREWVNSVYSKRQAKRILATIDAYFASVSAREQDNE